MKNSDLWKQIVEALRPHVYEFKWVAGHTGVDLNERCDVLAGAARKALKAELATRPELVAA